MLVSMTPQILDQFGNPIRLSAVREPQTEQLANVRSLYNELDEHPARGLTPQRIHAILREAEEGQLIRQAELADDMEEREPQIHTELAKRKLALLKLDWDIEPPTNADAKETQAAEQLKEWVQSIPGFKTNILMDMLDAIFKGFSATEMWWQMEEGYLMPRFAYRPQRWFTLSEHRDAIHLRDNSPYGQSLRPFNWLLHRHPARSGYMGRQALCRVVMFPYLYKNMSTRDLAEFLEIYGLPLRLGKYPGGASDREKAALLRAVTDIGHNAAGIIPMGMEIDFQNAAATGTQVPFEAMLNRMDAAISKAIIGQTLTSGEGQHGTQALGNVHNEVRLDILAADAALVAETLTQQLLAPMALLNIAGMNPKRLPRFVIEVPEPEDIKLMADSLPKLASAGVQIGVKWVARKLRIPALDAGEEALQGTPAPTAAPGEGNAGAPKDKAAKDDKDDKAAKEAKDAKDATERQLNVLRVALATLAQDAGGEPEPARDALDDLIDQGIAQPRALMHGLVQPLIDELDGAIRGGETAQAFLARLPGLFARMDSRAFGDSIAKASFVAQLAGLADLQLSRDDGTVV